MNYLLSQQAAKRIVSATKKVEGMIQGGKIASYKGPPALTIPATNHPFKLYGQNTGLSNKAGLQLAIFPGTITTGLWSDDTQTTQKGSHVPTVLVSATDIPLDTTGETLPLIAELPDAFSVWLEIKSGDYDDWISTRIIVSDSTDTDPTNDFQSGYLLIGKGQLIKVGTAVEIVEEEPTTVDVYGIDIINQYLIANHNHDKANATHYWWI